MSQGPGTPMDNTGPLDRGTPKTPTPPPSPPADPLTTPQRNAYNYLLAMFEDWGLGTLAPRILEMLQRGLNESAISYELQQTPEYKERFKANDARRKAGLSVLSPKEYLETERSYRQIMSSAGLPPGFYDSPDDFTKWLSTDVAPAEVKERVDLEVGRANSLDDAAKEVLWRDYGLSPHDLAAYYLDQERALPILQKINKGMNVGIAAQRQGLQVGVERAQELSGSNLAGNADQLYGQVAANTREGRRIAEIYGDLYEQKDAEDEAFLGTESARRKRKSLADKEAGTFGGSGGVGRGSLTQSGQY